MDSPSVEIKKYVPEFCIKAKFSYILVVNISGSVIGSVIMYFWLQLRTIRGFGTFLFLYALFLLYMIGDLIYWKHNGVHEVRLYDNYFEVIRGKKQKLIKVNYADITDINLNNKLIRVSLQILLEAKTVRIPGIYTYYPGKKIWITNDAFNEKEFRAMCDLLKEKYELYQVKA